MHRIIQAATNICYWSKKCSMATTSSALTFFVKVIMANSKFTVIYNRMHESLLLVVNVKWYIRMKSSDQKKGGCVSIYDKETQHKKTGLYINKMFKKRVVFCFTSSSLWCIPFVLMTLVSLFCCCLFSILLSLLSSEGAEFANRMSQFLYSRRVKSQMFHTAIVPSLSARY